MKKVLVRFITDESGTIAIEYSLIALLISVVIIGALAMSGTILSQTYLAISTTVAAAV
jgi:pilus assembly protein Flp/PilA